jgi:integrase/recombinase XerD
VLKLKKRGNMWYAVGKIKGYRYRVSTEIPVGTKAHKEAAQRRVGEIDVEIRSGKHGWTKDIPTFKAWWETYKRDHLPLKSARTRTRDIGTMSLHALPFFGHMRLDTIKKTDCLRYLNTRRQATQANPLRKTPGTIAEGTVQRERAFLQAFFQQAIEDGHIDKNPWRGIERVEYEVRDRVLTDAEQVQLLSGLSPRFQRFVLFLLGTGLRLDECRGIDPSRDVDLAARRVRVTRKGGKVQDVPFTEDVAKVLQAQLNEDGCLWTQNPQRLREVLAEGARKAKIAHLSPHTLRHTFGWRWLRDGGDIYKLSKVLGHATVAVTERHYAHLLKEDLSKAVDDRNLGIAVSVKAVVTPAEPVSPSVAAKVLRGSFGGRAS